MANKILFLDRDGTLNVDKGYINDMAMLELIPTAKEALLLARENGFLLSMITNQAGIAKGLTPPDMPRKICEHIETVCGVKFDDFRVCPHRPEDNCQCRKPGFLNLKQSFELLNGDSSRSWFIGDHVKDMEAAHRFGIKYILVRTGHGANSAEEIKSHSELKPSYIANDVLDAIRWIIKLSDC